MSDSTIQFVHQELGIQHTHSFGKYFGFSILNERDNQSDFSFIFDKVRSKLGGWRAHPLSFAGRETIIQSTIAPIVNHHSNIYPSQRVFVKN